MRKIVVFFVFFICGNVFGQTEVPNVIPPTPEAFNFTKYGEIPVNESSGNANVDVPLLEFTSGKIKMPISIFHSGGALKIDEDNTWTGIKWQLNAGGVITRTVNDRADEKSTGNTRRFYTSAQINSFIPDQSSELLALTHNPIDSEVDIFNYNFHGYSGSFYIDSIPRLIKYDKEIKIELSADLVVNGVIKLDKRTIKITTPDGNIYHFGGEDASEQSTVVSGPGQNAEFAQTSFYLFKIENIYGDIMSFNYDRTPGTTSQIIGVSQSLTKDESIEPNTNCGPTLGTIISSPLRSYLNTLGKRRLVSITTNRDNSKVVFESTPNSINLSNRYILNHIVLKNNNDSIVNKVSLKYIYPSNPYHSYKRFFLSEIEFNSNVSGNDDKKEKYFFEYNNPDLLPDRFSMAQDYAGYFNGVENNTTYIPKVNDPFFVLDPNVAFANRRVNFNYTCYGSLSKVTYPTKGFTEFEYETSQFPGDNFELITKYLNIYYNDPSRPNSDGRKAIGDTFSTAPDPNARTTASTLNPTVPVTVTISGNVEGYLPQQCAIKFSLKNLSTNVVQSQQFSVYNASGGNKEYTANYSFNNLTANANYQYTLEYFTINGGAFNPTSMNVSAIVRFATNENIPDFQPGIRVKRVKNYTSVNGTPEITRYYYNKLGRRNKENVSRLREPNFVLRNKTLGHCEQGSPFPVCMVYTVYKKIIFSEMQNGYIVNDIFYNFVTVSYGGDNFEKGGKQTEYFFQNDIPMVGYNYDSEYISLSKFSNNSLKNGTVLNEIYFSNNFSTNIAGDIITGKVKEVTFNYITLPEKSTSIDNCFVRKMHERPYCQYILPFLYSSNFLFANYTIFSWWHTLESKITKEYFNNNILQTSEIYKYDSKLAGFPSSVTTTTTNNDMLTTKYFYPQDQTMSAKPSVGLLKNRNIIVPLVTENWRNIVKLSEKETVYGTEDEFITNPLLPSFIQSAKGTQTLEKNITFNKYDSNGNLNQYTLENGIPVVILWGYHKSQPIAKIENATYKQVQLYESNLQTLSDGNNEVSLIQALNNLRNSLPKSMVTTYTHKPLIGISTVTDPKGNKQTYRYNAFNRLEFVKDKDGNIISENSYHYKN